jgi:hypothetical protein
MILVGLVILGLAVAIALYHIIVFGILGTLLPGYTQTESTLWVSLFIVAPISALLGGIVTGYLAYPRIDKKWKLMVTAPGLYFGGLFVVLLIHSTIVIGALVIGFFWYLVSLGGVRLGLFLRSYIIHNHLTKRTD